MAQAEKKSIVLMTDALNAAHRALYEYVDEFTLRRLDSEVEKACAADPFDPAARSAYGFLQIARNDPSAIETFSNVYESMPKDDPVSGANYGMSLHRFAQPFDSLQILERTWHSTNKNLEVGHALFGESLLAGKLEQAESIIRTWESEPNSSLKPSRSLFNRFQVLLEDNPGIDLSATADLIEAAAQLCKRKHYVPRFVAASINSGDEGSWLDIPIHVEVEHVSELSAFSVEIAETLADTDIFDRLGESTALHFRRFPDPQLRQSARKLVQ